MVISAGSVAIPLHGCPADVLLDEDPADAGLPAAILPCPRGMAAFPTPPRHPDRRKDRRRPAAPSPPATTVERRPEPQRCLSLETGLMGEVPQRVLPGPVPLRRERETRQRWIAIFHDLVWSRVTSRRK
jgi:hypothetical protein